MDYVVSSDNGNSSTKMILNSEKGRVAVKQKTVISPILTRPTFTETEMNVAIANLFDNMVVHINSPAIKQGGLYAVGEKAGSVGNAPRNLNIRIGEKHRDDIPMIMSLSLIATNAVKDYYSEHSELPQSINVSAKYSAALPAREFTPTIAKEFETRFTSNNHMIDVYVGEHQVTVNLTFQKAKITQEGNPALFAIIEGDRDLVKDFNERYKVTFKNKDFFGKKLLLIDIGDGTTEFIYLVKGKPITDLCTGMRFGVGHAADSAQKLFAELTKVNITMNRQQFMNAVLDDTHHYHQEALQAMHLANVAQATLINEFAQERFLNDLQGDVDIMVVFGGGASAFEKQLAPELYEFADSVKAKVLWIPKDKAALMNVEGSNILNEKLFFKE